MSKQAIADFEAQLQKLCEFWLKKLTHAELVGTLDTVKMGYHIRTFQNFEDTEQSETPVIQGEQANAPVNIRDPIKKNSGSPVPVK